MKKFLFVVACLVFCCLSQSLQAQFLKKLGDKIEKSVERGMDRKTDQADEKSLDKAEDGTEKVVNDVTSTSPVASSSKDQGETAQLPEDYQLALTGSGPDLYLEYRMAVNGEASSGYQMDMHMKMFASPATGMGRSEMVMTMPMIGEMSMVTLTDAKDPLRIVVLNERKKQYSILDLSGIEESESEEIYTVTKLGEEKLHGLHCVRSKAVTQDGQAFELWTTTEVPGYEKLLSLYSSSQKMGSGDLWKKLQEAGCAGFMVKMKVEVKGGTTVMELTEIKNVSTPETLFQVPTDYEEKEGGWAKRFMKMGK